VFVDSYYPFRFVVLYYTKKSRIPRHDTLFFGERVLGEAAYALSTWINSFYAGVIHSFTPSCPPVQLQSFGHIGARDSTLRVSRRRYLEVQQK
jgi:hypothetical protein